MGDQYPKLKVAAKQAKPVLFDREALTDKACDLIRKAGQNGAKVKDFPEGFIPTQLSWLHYHPGTDVPATHLCVELFKNSIEIPEQYLNLLYEEARDACANVEIGACEKMPIIVGAMFNTQLCVEPGGRYLGKHQKTMATVGECLVYEGVSGDTVVAIQSECGSLSGFMCGEYLNLPTIFTLVTEGIRLRVLAWPNNFPKMSQPMSERVITISKIFNLMSKAYVVSVGATVSDRLIEMLELSPEKEHLIRVPKNTGGLFVIAPATRVKIGPMGNEEGVLYAAIDIDMDACIRMKVCHDLANRYARPDIFQLRTNYSVPKLNKSCGLGRAIIRPGTSLRRNYIKKRKPNQEKTRIAIDYKYHS